jgi:hypothetical protein
LLGGGKVHVEARTSAGCARDLDEAAGIADDPLHGCEADTGALADVLRREERLEDAREDGLVHADASVCHAQLREHPLPLADHRRRLDGESAAPGMASLAFTARLRNTCSS